MREYPRQSVGYSRIRCDAIQRQRRMNSLLLCRPSSYSRASRWLLASVHSGQGRTGHDHNSSLCQIPYRNCPENIQNSFLSAPPFLQFPSAGLAESARLQTIVRRSKGEERRGGRAVCISEEGGEMEMRKKAMLWLAFACTVGSLGLLVAPGMVHGRDSTPLSFVKKTVASHSIVIFSKSYCPYCKRAKNVFKELEENPFVVELDQREDGAKIQDALFELVQRRTVPQVFIDGEHIGGSDDTLEAHRSGRLKKLLGSKQSGAWQHDIS